MWRKKLSTSTRIFWLMWKHVFKQAWYGILSSIKPIYSLLGIQGTWNDRLFGTSIMVQVWWLFALGIQSFFSEAAQDDRAVNILPEIRRHITYSLRTPSLSCDWKIVKFNVKPSELSLKAHIYQVTYPSQTENKK